MPTFPSYAKILRDGFAVKRESALLRSEMESGPPKQAKVRSRVMIERPVRVIVETLADYNSFVTWFSTTINEGNDWFDWTDPVDGVTKAVRFVGGGLDASPAATTQGAWFFNGLKIEGWGV